VLKASESVETAADNLREKVETFLGGRGLTPDHSIVGKNVATKWKPARRG
jgi:hypothetical protein